MPNSRVPRRYAVLAVFVVVSLQAAIASARSIDHVRDHNAANRILRAAENRESLVISGLPLGRPELDQIELIPMEVWGPHAKVVVHGKDGSIEELPPPSTRYFRGRVAGDSEASVFIAVDGDDITGHVVMAGGKRFQLGLGKRVGKTPVEESAPLLLREIDEAEAPKAKDGWTCGTDQLEVDEGHIELPEQALKLRGTTNSGSTVGASYTLTVAVETDFELFSAFGSVGAVTTYIGNLVGNTSVIYQRDIGTALQLGVLQVRSDAGDPWTVAAAGLSSFSPALAEFGTYYHNNYPIASNPRSAAMFVTGKLFSGGLAFINQLCATSDINCGATGATCNGGAPSADWANKFGGHYGFIGSSGSVSTTVPNPDATVSGVQYRMPYANNFWMLAGFAHELGHVVSSPHSNCYALDAPKQAQYNVPGRTHVDYCLSGGTGCYSGSLSAPAELGSIMSYCHNINPGVGNNVILSRYTLGRPGEPSNEVSTAMRTSVHNKTPDGAITMADSVSCAAGQTASVPVCGSCTYSWQITGGTITSASNIASITFTPNAASVTVTATVLNSTLCGIVRSKTATASCGSLTAPTGLVATPVPATSNVLVTWNAVAGAASYQIHRSTNNSSYSQVGTSNLPSFNDGTALANTAYSYQVRGVDGSANNGPFSGKDFATTVIFTDTTLTAGSTTVKILHLTQLRTAVNALRTLAGLSGATFTDPIVTNTTGVKRIHIIELRTALDAARAALAAGAISYTDPTITAGITQPKAAHFTELRSGVQ